MNERIKELYIQTSNETADGNEWAIGGLHNAERFAELIVRECIKQARKDENGLAYEAVGRIAEHFGLKEQK